MTAPLRLAPFLFALLCLLLPFAEVACGDKDPQLGEINVVKITGWEILSGQKEQSQRASNHNPNYLLIATAAVLVLGLLAAANESSRRFAALCGLVATCCLVYFTAHLREAVLPPGLPLQQLLRSSGSEFNIRSPEFDKFSADLAKEITVTPQPGLHAITICALLAAILSALPKSRKAEP